MEDSERLARRIEVRETDLDRRSAELDELQRQSQQLKFNHADVATYIQECTDRIQRMERDVQPYLRQLVGKIDAVPFRQFDGDKIVLRGRFLFDPVNLLPARIRLALRQRHQGSLLEKLPDWLRPIRLDVNLFEPSTGPRHGIEAERLEREEGLGLTAIGLRLGYDKRIAKRRANLAVQYGRKLRAAGLTDPFIELSDCPSSASRWKIDPPQEGPV